MPLSYYREAQKLAQKEFRSCLFHGEHPYLPVLDDFLPAQYQGTNVDLGLVQIPLDFVVGTRTGGRTNAFARNFMPLLEESTEFASKWALLCKAHLEEGIHEPILAYEYLNRYYVQEGNKRVSVLKFFGAQLIEAKVVRILPRHTGSPAVERYYEFVEFHRLSGINFIEFSKPGSYAQLQRYVGKAPDEPWTDRDRAKFTTVCYYFRQAYEKLGGRALTSTMGDALLAYLVIYGYPSLLGKSPSEIQKTVENAWEEMALQQEEQPIDVKLSPPEERTPGLLSKVLPKAEPKKIKVAFLHDKSPKESGWTYGHELGRLHIQEVFQGELETTAYCHALDTDPLPLLEKAIADGNKVIFTTSPRLLPASLRAAVDHRDAVILNCSLNTSHRYVRTYYARMYEAKYIIGAIAGALARDNKVGFICDYPIYGQVAGVNAFALGAQLTNPTARVYLEWSSIGGLDRATARLTEQGIRLISTQDLAPVGHPNAATFGLSLITDAGRVNLAMPLWQWGVYYEKLLRLIRDGSFQAEGDRSPKALNYYWGLSAGVVEVLCSQKLPDSLRRLRDVLQRSISSGLCHPFQGPIYTQDGKKLLGADQALTPEQIITMNYLVDTVTGHIPAMEELDPQAQATVGIVGVQAQERGQEG